MGCHGIGVSRIIGAVAHCLADDKGLTWPASIAPYSCVVIPGRVADEPDAQIIAQQLAVTFATRTEVLDVILDDRHLSLPWRLTDADLIGFPIKVVLGRDWRASKRVEIQSRTQRGCKSLLADSSDIYHVVCSLL